jgi:hypothetical protein
MLAGRKLNFVMNRRSIEQQEEKRLAEEIHNE